MNTGTDWERNRGIVMKVRCWGLWFGISIPLLCIMLDQPAAVLHLCLCVYILTNTHSQVTETADGLHPAEMKQLVSLKMHASPIISVVFMRARQIQWLSMKLTSSLHAYAYICVCVCAYILYVCIYVYIYTVSSTNIGTLDKYEQRQLWK